MSKTRSVQDDKKSPPGSSFTSLPRQALIALTAGIACGVFFGEGAGRIRFVGDIYIRLLQMMVLPYIILSLIGGVGRLNAEQARKLIRYGILVLMSLWLVAGTIIVVMPFITHQDCQGIRELPGGQRRQHGSQKRSPFEQPNHIADRQTDRGGDGGTHHGLA